MAVRTSLGAWYRPFWIQGGSDVSAKDSLAEWGLAVKSFPFKALPDPKEPYKNEWHDEDGDDEYNSQMFYEAYEISVDFLMSAQTSEEIVLSMKSFFNCIRNGEFMIFDTYSQIGRRGVRYAGYGENAFKYREGGVCYAVFSVKFKVNDPVTFIYKNGDVLEARI